MGEGKGDVKRCYACNKVYRCGVQDNYLATHCVDAANIYDPKLTTPVNNCWTAPGCHDCCYFFPPNHKLRVLSLRVAIVTLEREIERERERERERKRERERESERDRENMVCSTCHRVLKVSLRNLCSF